ncbi:hypothetical protein B0H10DRAFT_2212913 [Mycena sp. CBHHK59/15]|nr:hypothetical protein B0H10DRAFT_2212913 [Mycena sp. CBHHK59/15]
MVTIARHCAKRQSSIKTTETTLNRLIVGTIETGAITAGVALLTLILFKIFPSAYYYVATEFVLGRTYSNVLFATLNGRNRSRNNLPSAISNFGTINRENFGTEMGPLTSAHTLNAPKIDNHSRGVVITTTVDTDQVSWPRLDGKITPI